MFVIMILLKQEIIESKIENKTKRGRRKLPETSEKSIAVRFDNNTFRFVEFKYNQAPLKYRSLGGVVRESVELLMRDKSIKSEHSGG
jgi:hypothetical protein